MTRVKSHNLIRAFALPGYNLQYPLILQTDSKDPDQMLNVQADLGLHCLHKPEDTLLLGAAHVIGYVISRIAVL